MKTWQVVALSVVGAGVVFGVVYAVTRSDTTSEILPSNAVDNRPVDAAAETARGLSGVAQTVANAVARGEERRLDREAEAARQRREDAVRERERQERREDAALAANRTNR